MSLATPAVPETLRARPRRWLSHLWVRVSLVLLLIFAISLFTWWLPRRSMISVWRNGGQVFCESDASRAVAILQWIDPARSWSGLDSDTVYWVLGLSRSDAGITRVHLNDSKVGDDWLVRLKRFPKLTSASLHDRQLGAGLDDLRGCMELKDIEVKAASDRHLVELRRLPQIESLSLWGPQAGDIGLESLNALSKLKLLFIADCKYTDEILKALPELPSLETLTFYNSTGFVDEDFHYLNRNPNLKTLAILCSTSSLGDVALEHVSQLKGLERLALLTPWTDVTDAGLAKLTTMKSLKQIIVSGAQCSPGQLQRLQKALPNCVITVN